MNVFKISVLGLLGTCFCIIAAEPMDLLSQVQPSLLAPKCNAEEVGDELMTVVKCAEVKVENKLTMTPTEVFVWNKLRGIMTLTTSSENDLNTSERTDMPSNCKDFTAKDSREARCCVITLGSKTVMYCTYKNLLETEAGTEIPAKETCDCKQLSTTGGTCYFMPSSESNYCTKRKCKPTFECVSAKTGLTCLRRKEVSKIVQVAPNFCVKKAATGYTYVPYTTY